MSNFGDAALPSSFDDEGYLPEGWIWVHRVSSAV